uniref:Polypeptide N-acetylgalactosaminyltransferase n=1 Tax=Ciona savignyi TaxID=51511 RepID=H2ZBM2_CIOSA
QLVSDRIGLQSRDIPDTRPVKCKEYPESHVQHQVSVVICYYNEALSTLMRTVSTIFKRTPPALLKEIIVVDDGSTDKEILPEVERLVAKFYLESKLHGLRSDEQQGLIRARMFGARYATGFPTISGGLFAVDRDFFFALGGYDERMEEWGGENLELSFRTWMCGGEMGISPCSRVGHVFRHRRPYGGGNNAALLNSVRVARVWLDEFIEHFYATRSFAKQLTPHGLTERVKLRETLKCKSFKWYLNKVYPELPIPGVRTSRIQYSRPDDHTVELARGKLSVAGLNICLRGDRKKGSPLVAVECTDKTPDLIWSFNNQGEIRFDKRMCLDGSVLPRVMKCDGGRGLQRWSFLKQKQVSGKIYNIAVGLCLSINQTGKTFDAVLKICDHPSVQTFKFSN